MAGEFRKALDEATGTTVSESSVPVLDLPKFNAGKRASQLTLQEQEQVAANYARIVSDADLKIAVKDAEVLLSIYKKAIQLPNFVD